jgi:spore germination protein YaaH
MVWLSVVLAGAVIFYLTLGTHQSAPRPTPVVVAAVPYWTMAQSTATVLSNRHDFSEISPWIYGLDSNGRVVPQYGPAQQAALDADLARLRAAGFPIVPTIANMTQGNWAYPAIARILHSPALMAQHVAAIVALVRQHNYAGIDIDYENLRAADRQVFSTFVADLAAALHAHGKVLSVALFAKTTDAGYDQRNVAQNYAALGRAADQVRLMCYDFHWQTSPPGPVAPIGWVRTVLRYAKTQIPAHKIILGIPLYGYDWIGNRGTPLSWLQAFQLSVKYNAQPRFDTVSQTPWFAYTDSAGRKHQVWFENVASSKAKFGAAEGAGIGGVFLWMYGYEQTSTWPALHSTLPITAHSAGTTARASQ